MTVTIGYDVGGAHLKIARIDAGRLTAVEVVACPLWRGLNELDIALARTSAIADGADRHAVTMTAELTEIFASRAEGVAALTGHLRESLGPSARFYMSLKGFGDAGAACANPEATASANFLATATLTARLRPHSLLIDMGSTTTDIIACDRPQGLSDAERLATGELVYVGLTRTPVPSIATRAPLAGQWQGLARDPFANMADVRRLLGTLPDGLDLHDTTDGRGKSVPESLARFARGFGRDADMRRLEDWRHAANFIREAELAAVIEGATQVVTRPGLIITGAVTAGIGHDEAAEIARRLGLPPIAFGDLLPAADAALKPQATCHASAVAVAMLAAP